LKDQEWLDSVGQIWLGDAYFTGGSFVSRPSRQIYRTFDQQLYRTAREGDFRYDIPLDPGIYELHLHFSEIVFGDNWFNTDSTGERRFRVLANGEPILRKFDIIVDAGGPNVADERVFTDVTPAEDGMLHLEFQTARHGALLAGIEVLSGRPGRMQAVQLVPRTRLYTEDDGRVWKPDRYFLGGRLLESLSLTAGDVEGELYGSQRFGHFSYAIPVAQGKYTATLRFVEAHYGAPNERTPDTQTGGEGSRVFNVFCNGEALLKNFDVFQEAGGPSIPLARTFRGLEPSAQGKLVFSFVPVKDYATVSAIEILPEG
ncbi:MAG: hypothetical protein GY953_44840, partial [bacterium]|nr:hypothetical protein [bacterium]